jgi:hypothetical protein
VGVLLEVGAFFGDQMVGQRPFLVSGFSFVARLISLSLDVPGGKVLYYK